MKKLISIPLLGCFFFNVIGYHVVFYLQRAEIKNGMKRLISQGSKDETKLVFPLNDKELLQKISWDDDEFYFNGQMYDLIEKNIQDGKLVIRCIADKKETALVNNLNDSCGANANDNKITTELLQFLQTLFRNSESDKLAFVTDAEHHFISPLERLQFQIKEIPTPPPQA